jgi:hypothetical protein
MRMHLSADTSELIFAVFSVYLGTTMHPTFRVLYLKSKLKETSSVLDYILTEPPALTSTPYFKRFMIELLKKTSSYILRATTSSPYFTALYSLF